MKKINSTKIYDVVVIGAGVAGLNCALELKKQHLKVLVLEARDRVGGRIFSYKDPHLKFPIELGAEFLHGDAPESRKIFDELGGYYYDVNEDCYKKTPRGFKKFPFFESVETYFAKLNSKRKKDRSAQEFLESKKVPSTLKPYLQSFIEGFHAADTRLIGEIGLSMAEQATGEKENLKSARLLIPYAELPNSILQKLGSEKVRLNTLAKKIQWRQGAVRVECHDQISKEVYTVSAKAAVIAIPLGVLKAPSSSKAFIEFSPRWTDLEKSLAELHMGNVSRMVFSFKEKFWEKEFPKSLGYIHLGPQYDYATWWGHSPLHAPFLTAWQGGPKATELANYSHEERVALATKTLSKAFGLKPREISKQILQVYEHDWTSDPYSLGAYSYIGIDGANAARKLSRPLKNTLFLCGEATQPGGLRGTVEGALKSGQRAAMQILRLTKR